MPYAHPESLIETEWLAAHLDDPDIRVVDASFKLPGITPMAREDYDRGHIPGTVFFDIDDIAEPGTRLPHMIPSPELFARKMEGLGIGDDDRVIVYDSAGLSSAGRAWWMLRLFGHHNVALLDGGLPKWKAEGRPLETAVPNPPIDGARKRVPQRAARIARWRLIESNRIDLAIAEVSIAQQEKMPRANATDRSERRGARRLRPGVT